MWKSNEETEQQTRNLTKEDCLSNLTDISLNLSRRTNPSIRKKELIKRLKGQVKKNEKEFISFKDLDISISDETKEWYESTRRDYISNWIVVDAVGRQYLNHGRFNSKEECLIVCGRLNTNHPEFDFRPVLDGRESEEKLY